MARTLSLMIAFSALIASGAFLYTEVRATQAPPQWPALTEPAMPWQPRNFAAVGETPGEYYDFVTGLVFDAGSDAAARLAVHYRSPDDCLYVEIVGRYLSVAGMRAGLKRELCHVEMPSALSPGTEHAVALRRRGPTLVAVIDGRVTAAAFVEGFEGGQAAVGQRGAGLKFVRPVAAELEPVLFMDDFMRSEKSATPWETVSGSWRNKGLPNPSMSANAFRFCGSGSPAMAVTGLDTWADYSFAASLCATPGGAAGLAFAYRNERNHYLFRWSAREKPEESARGLAELVCVRDGQERVVDSCLVGYIPGQWYRAEVRSGWGWAEVYLDEQLVLAGADPELCGGRVGLWSRSSEPTYFDDVRVAEATFFREDFRGPASTWRSWDCLGGDWHQADGRTAEGLEFSAGPEGGLRVFGSARWGDYAVRAEILARSGRAGLVYHYQDATSYSCLAYDVEAGVLELIAVRGGQRRVLASRQVRLSPEMHTFEVFLDRGLTRARVDGAHEVSAWQTDSEQGGAGLAELGRAGLAVWGGQALARSMTLQLSGEIEPLPAINPIFATDREMVNWSSWHGDWSQKNVGGKDIRWHRANFTGDVALLVEVAKFQGESYELALSVAKSGEKSNNGYILTLARPVPAGLPARAAAPGEAGAPAAGQPAGAALVLTRDGQTVAHSPVPGGERVWTLGLRRAGPFVIGYVNSRQVLWFFDSEPLVGQKVAWYSRGVEVESDGFRVYSPAVVNYPFSKAPSEWREAAGLWEVSQRWQCDPRWSFFSGRSVSHQEEALTAAQQALPADRKLQAVLWNKRLYGDDVVVEFFAGIKMLRQKGNRYEYARDINCTISADGKDVSSGYSFLFGGFDNDHSAILRRGKEVARTPSGGVYAIPRQTNIHHRWFYIRAERKGPKLQFSVDGGKDINLEYTDPDPLPGSRVAIWTWDCGIMISRVRISGSPALGFEPVDFVPGTKCRSPYADD